LPAQYAAKCGLLLTRVEPFQVSIQNQRPDWLLLNTYFSSLEWLTNALCHNASLAL
jgi:hypothetical protein